MIEKFKKYRFVFEELIKRDFKKKYKRTVLGMGWSLVSPLLQLLVMGIVFTQIFGRDIPHFIIYMFSGNLIFGFFREATMGGMTSLVHNSAIITKINVPKYLFLLAKISASLINFLLTLCIYFIFVAIDGIIFSPRFFLLIYPVICLLIFNIGIGAILSALYVFFKDIQYLYDIFIMLLLYVSAIFYSVDMFPDKYQLLFNFNPIYVYIKYFRQVVIEGIMPSLQHHVLCLIYALLALITGAWIYKKNNYKFIYYM